MGLYSVDLNGYAGLTDLLIPKGNKNELEEYTDILYTRLRIENLRDRTIEDYMKSLMNLITTL